MRLKEFVTHGGRLLLGAILTLPVGPPDLAARPWFATNFDIYSLGSLDTLLPFDGNHDGELDLITAKGILVLGQANGDFIAGTGFTPPLTTTDEAVFDVNGDGWQDVMVMGRSSPGTGPPQYIFVYRKLVGNGFAASTAHVLPVYAQALFAGDFDGNGLDDALTLHIAANTPEDTDLATVHLAGPGGLGPRLDVVLPEGAPFDAAVADFDADGKSDAIILCHFPGEPRSLLYYMSASGGFAAAPAVDTLQAPNALNLGAGDVNNDGHADFATANANGTNTIFLGNGDGTFNVLPLPIDAIGQFCGYVQFDDVDLDGNLDLVGACVGATDDIVNILYGDGAGRFDDRFRHHFSRRSKTLVVNDFDHDGFNDIVGGFSIGVGVLWGNAAGTFNVIPSFPLPAGTSEGFAIDWDTDGWEDLVTVNRTPATISILRNLGGQFDAATSIPLGFAPGGIRFGDLDLDGDRDIVAVDANADLVRVLLRDAGGGFSESHAYPVGFDPSDVAFGDFNQDGLPDLVVSNFAYPTWSASYLRGIGAGQFQPAGSVATNSTPSSIAVGDFNEDGKLDFVTGHPFDKCSLVLGRGDGTFNPFVTIGSGNSTPPTSPVQIHDMNNDGHLDLLMNRQGNAGFRYGTGLGTFGGLVTYGLAASNIAVRDLDLDGRLDLAAGASDYATARFGSALGTQNYYGVDKSVIWVTPIAFDGGPSLELAVMVSNGPKVMILAHADATSDVPPSGPAPAAMAMPFRLAVNPARSVAGFQMTRDLDGPASASIVDINGRRIAAMPEFPPRSGARFEWQGRNDSGHPVAAGRYYAILGHDRDRWSIPFLWFP